MDDYMKGWKDIRNCEIPTVEKKNGKNMVIIREYIAPIKKVRPANVKPVDVKPVEEYTELEDDDATILLNRGKTICAYIKRMNTGEEVYIDKYPFIIGKAKDCDYCLKDNPTISRHHAKIKKIGDVFSIEDMGSSNFTYVDGKQVDNEIVLKEQAEITLSDEIFSFRLEIK